MDIAQHSKDYRSPGAERLVEGGWVQQFDLAGLGAKVCVACGGGGLAPIFWLYLLNTGSVAANLALQWHYGHRLSASRSAFRTSD